MTLSELRKVIDVLLKHWELDHPPSVALPDLPFRVPRGLTEIYGAFHDTWDDEGRSIRGHQDFLLNITELELTGCSWRDQPCTPGRVLFATENQAVWIATTLPEEVEDAPVEFYYDTKPVRNIDSLNRFLASFVLREAVMGASHGGRSSTKISDAVWRDRGFRHLLTDTEPLVAWHYTSYYTNPDSTIFIATYPDGAVSAVSSRSPLPTWPELA